MFVSKISKDFTAILGYPLVGRIQTKSTSFPGDRNIRTKVCSLGNKNYRGWFGIPFFIIYCTDCEKWLNDVKRLVTPLFINQTMRF